MKHAEIPAIAAGALPFGSPAAYDDRGELVPLEIVAEIDWEQRLAVTGPVESMAGVVRPVPGTHYVDGKTAWAGDAVLLKTDGSIMTIFGRKTLMVELVDGKPVRPA